MVASRFEYRIQTGHVSIVTIQANTAAVLANFTRAADQPVNIPWGIAEYPRAKTYAQRRRLLNGKFDAQGYTSFTLFVSAMTPGMMEWWNSEFLDGVESADVTVQIPDKRYLAANQTKVYQGIIHRPEEGNDYQWAKGFIPLATSIPYLVTNATLLS